MNAILNRPNHQKRNMFIDPMFFGHPRYINPKTENHLDSKVYTNIIQTDSGYNIELAAPGFTKDNFHIDFSDQKLTIKLIPTADAEVSETKIYLRQEFSKKGFERSFKLSNEIDTEKISAIYEFGILTVSLVNQEKIVQKINIH